MCFGIDNTNGSTTLGTPVDFGFFSFATPFVNAGLGTSVGAYGMDGWIANKFSTDTYFW